MIAFNDQGLLLDGDSTSNAFNLVFGNGFDSFTPGPGTLQADPLFTEALTPTSQSPVRNAGSNAHVPADLTVDLVGGPRIVGPQVDIGAYELPEPSGALASAAAATVLSALRRVHLRRRWAA